MIYRVPTVAMPTMMMILTTAYTPDKDLFYNVVFCYNIYDYGELVESNRLV